MAGAFNKPLRRFSRSRLAVAADGDDVTVVKEAI
jgi:hypothetical protein